MEGAIEKRRSGPPRTWSVRPALQGAVAARRPRRWACDAAAAEAGLAQLAAAGAATVAALPGGGGRCFLPAPRLLAFVHAASRAAAAPHYARLLDA